jgi:hypothetical protein
MPDEPNERAVVHLERLCAYFQSQLTQLPWPSEEARWIELASCIAERCAGDLDPLAVRDGIGQLHFLGLLDPETLAPEEGGGGARDELVMARRVLVRCGFEADAAARAVDAIAAAAGAFAAQFGGKPQLFMHQQGEAIVTDLARLLQETGLDDEELGHVCRQWLQNGFGIPVPLIVPSLQRLCARVGATIDEIFDAADAIGLNVSLVDDLAEMAEADPAFWAWSQGLDDEDLARPLESAGA